MSARAMFGAYGLYRYDKIFAVIAGGQLYFKADTSSRKEFEEKGLQPFTYVARGKNVSLQYFEAPPEVFEEPAAMRSWTQKAIEAAAKPKRSSKTPGTRVQRPNKKSRPG